MKYSFDDADAGTQKQVQYYAMLGTRAIWHRGWKAVAVHGPTSGIGKFDQDQWQLFHTDEDRAEEHDLAEEHPDKLRELVNVWFNEAGKYDVLPLDDRTPPEIANVPRPMETTPRDNYVYYPDTLEVPENSAVNVRSRSYRILADVELEDADAAGVIFAQGSRFGGHALFIKDRKLHYVYNFLGIKPEQLYVSEELAPGKHVLGMEFAKESQGQYAEAHGTTKLYVDDDVVAEGDMRTQVAWFALAGEGLCIGRDSSDPVSEHYADGAGFPFTGGTIAKVEINVGDDQYVDLEKEAWAMFARE